MPMCFVITFWLSTIYACGHVDTANLFSSGIEGLFIKTSQFMYQILRRG